MPLYDFIDKKTSEEWEQFMSYDDMKTLTASGDIAVVYRTMTIVGGHGDRVRSDNGFKEVLSKIAEGHPHSALASQYGAKDSKAVKVRETVNKHRK